MSVPRPYNLNSDAAVITSLKHSLVRSGSLTKKCSVVGYSGALFTIVRYSYLSTKHFLISLTVMDRLNPNGVNTLINGLRKRFLEVGSDGT